MSDRPRTSGLGPRAQTRVATREDCVALASLKLRTFRETFLEGGFGIAYPADDLAIFEEGYSEAQVRRELSDESHTTWVGEADGALVGYAHVGPCKLPHPEVRSGDGELYQLYLLRSAQGTGLGRSLLDIALAHLEKTRPGPIWLGVWSGNTKAQAVYAKRGFEKAGEYEFPVGSWRDHEFIFRRR